MIVVANFANRSDDSYTIGFPRSGYWHVRFNSDWNGYSPDFGNHLSYDTTAGGAGRAPNQNLLDYSIVSVVHLHIDLCLLKRDRKSLHQLPKSFWTEG